MAEQQKKTERRLPDYMERAFAPGGSGKVIIWSQEYTRREDIPDQWWQDVPVQDAKASPASSGGKDGS